MGIYCKSGIIYEDDMADFVERNRNIIDKGVENNAHNRRDQFYLNVS